MFNAPRPAQRYGTSSSLVANNGFGSGSFTADDPLAGSGYDGLDPWSSAPSPDLPPPPSAAPSSPFASVIGTSQLSAQLMNIQLILTYSGRDGTSVVP